MQAHHRQQPTVQVSRIVLHGRLKKKFGPEFHFGVTTTGSAIRSLCNLVPGFEKEFSVGEYSIVRGDRKKGKWIDESRLKLMLNGADLHIIPASKGSKNSGGAKLVIGAVMVAAAIVSAGAATGFGAGFLAGMATPIIGTSGLTFGQVALFGGLMMLGGIAQLVSQQPKNTSGTNDQSFGLGGNLNTTAQGGAVPLAYGKILCGSTVISSGYEAADFAIGASTTITGGVTIGGSSGPTQITTYSGLAGAGGGGGKSGSNSGYNPHVDANTLRSDGIARVIDLISEGPIQGLVNGACSIYFNGTPLQAQDGTYNFQGVAWSSILGVPNQQPVPGYPAAEETVALPPQQMFSQTPIIQQFTSSTANAVLITVEVSALYSYDNNGNMNNGPDVGWTIDIAEFGGSYENVVDYVLSGQKTTTAYQKTFRINLPGVGTVLSWQFRVTRSTPDYDYNAEIAADTYLIGYNLVTDQQLMYPNSAYMALTIDAAAFGTSVPTRTYLINGLQIQIPANYDPVGRAYATSGPGTTGGTWDGHTFTTAWTNNPAWILYDLLSNSRYGLGLSTATLVDAASTLYTIGQYCDQIIPDGFGGTEPRYTLNVYISSQDDAFRAIQNIVSVFRGMMYWGYGQVQVTCDMPKEPTTIVTQANVIDGEFVYEGTGLDQRHTVARVTWLDPNNYYAQTVEWVENSALVAQWGQKPADIVAFGCTSRGQAHRQGKWLLDTEQYSTQTVTFSCGVDQLTVRPGQVFLQADPSYAGLRVSGRLQSGCTSTVLNLDAAIPAAMQNAGTPLYISVQMPDGSLEYGVPLSLGGEGSGEQITVITEGDINNSYSIVTLSQALRLAGGTGAPAAPDANAVWAIQAPGASPTNGAINLPQWMCVGISETSRGVFQVVGVSYDPTKYARVEDNIYLQPGTFSTLPALLSQPVPAPTGLQVISSIAGIGSTTLTNVVVSWTAPGWGTAPSPYLWNPALNSGQQFPSSPAVIGNNYYIVIDDTTVPPNAANGNFYSWNAGTYQWVPTQALSGSGTNPLIYRFEVSAIGSGVSTLGGNYNFGGTPTPPAWTAATLYTLVIGTNEVLDTSNLYYNGGNIYVLTQGGLSGATGPTGLGENIVDGSCLWTFYANYPAVQTATGSYTGDATTTNTSYEWQNLPPGTYTFGVRSINTNGAASAWVYIYGETISGQTIVPAAPTGLTATGGARQISLSWTANTERFVTGYEVWRAPISGINPAAAGGSLITVSGGTSYVDHDPALVATSLTETWYYWVRAITTTGVKGLFAGYVYATTNGLIADSLGAAIINTAAFAQSLQPVIIWDPPPGANDGGTGGIAGQVGAFPYNPSAVGSTMIYRTLDQQLYTWNGTNWSNLVPAANIIGNLIAGTGQIGAINANQIATGALRSPLISDNFQLSLNSQIGNAIINTANIQALTVGTLNIANQAVNSIAWSTAVFGAQVTCTYTTAVPYYGGGTPDVVLVSVFFEGYYQTSGNDSLGASITTGPSGTLYRYNAASGAWSGDLMAGGMTTLIGSASSGFQYNDVGLAPGNPYTYIFQGNQVTACSILIIGQHK